MKKILTFGTIMILAASLQCNAAEANKTDSTIRLRLLAGRPVVEGVFLNGKGPFRFLLDTGGQTNQLEAGLARELSLSSTFRVGMVTAAGTTHVAGVRVEEVPRRRESKGPGVSIYQPGGGARVVHEHSGGFGAGVPGAV